MKFTDDEILALSPEELLTHVLMLAYGATYFETLWEYAPDPVNNIVDAWMLVENMEEADVWFQLANAIPNSDPIVYEAMFSQGSRKRAYACEPTAPMAISRAWLLWENMREEKND